MAEAQERTAPRASTVNQCGATDCRHNENRECHAGEIQVRFEGGQAVCGTYEPGSPEARP